MRCGLARSRRGHSRPPWCGGSGWCAAATRRRRRRCASSWPRWPASVKIVRRHTRQAMAQRPDQLGAHRGDVVLTLQRSLDQQEALLDERQPVTVEERGTHDDVDQSRLVLEIEEHEALGGAGTLAAA